MLPQQRPMNVVSDLYKLESILLSPGHQTSDLQQLASPSYLHFLFHVTLCKVIKNGPTSVSPSLTPASLISIAQNVAALGILPLDSPLRLRVLLQELESNLHKERAWRQNTELWWHPLPESGPHEVRWQKVEQACSEAISKIRVWAKDAQQQWYHLQNCLPPKLASSINQELTQGHQLGLFRLERGNVGAHQQTSNHP